MTGAKNPDGFPQDLRIYDRVGPLLGLATKNETNGGGLEEAKPPPNRNPARDFESTRDTPCAVLILRTRRYRAVGIRHKVAAHRFSPKPGYAIGIE
ncbi:MAG: hypothetical protein NT142_12710 [Planctomycetota bacterium]|nr:hypothetical protein [Planctomycetota bacterium]